MYVDWLDDATFYKNKFVFYFFHNFPTIIVSFPFGNNKASPKVKKQP